MCIRDRDYSISFEKDSWNQVPGFESPRWIYLRDYHKENYECAAEQFRLKGTKVTLEEVMRRTCRFRHICSWVFRLQLFLRKYP